MFLLSPISPSFYFQVRTIRNNPDHHVLLFTDGHTTRHSMKLITLCRKNKVHLFCYPPHTTHVLQPLDVGVFQFFKANLKVSYLLICVTILFLTN